MKSGRKRTQADTAGEVKRLKTDSSVGESNITWEWEDDGHIWKPFSDELMKDIESAFINGQQKIKVEINEVKFDIIFDRMVQRNSKTFWERRIRANISGQDGGLAGKYEFDEGNGIWRQFNHSLQRLLFAGYAYNLQNVVYISRKQNYSIDLMGMLQINTKTKNKQEIRCGTETTNKENDNSNNVENGTSKSQKTRSSARSKRSTLNSMSDEDGEDNNDYNDLPVIRKKSKDDSTAGNVKQEKVEGHVVKSFSIKGKVPVDMECFARENYRVFYEGETVYDAMLNQTNLKNNNNKFYLMQILQNNSSKGYAVWFRWGRVGMVGQSNLVNCGNDLEEAKEMFCKKFFDKTKNEFADRKKFKKVPGKYDLLFMDYKSTAKEDELDELDGSSKQSNENKEIPPSRLDKKLQNLVELICSIKEMEEAVLEMKYDSKKAPLGKLTKEQIKVGYKALQKIDQLLSDKKTGDDLIRACDLFYTRVPHNFGMQRPPVIRTKKELQLKIQLLETLGDIEIAMKVLKRESKDFANPIDQHYFGLNCELKVLSHESNEFEIINKYTQNTHAKTHNQYKMEVIDVFEITKSPFNENFNDVGNRVLLWHGSRLTNWVGILSQGLRIAPPEAPVTGYMFGKGVYFADVSSKSANYCYPTRTKNTGFVMLCEVALGKPNKHLAADYDADKLPAGCHSTKGLGKFGPSDKDNIVMDDGVIVPAGVPCETGVKNPNGYTLNYNEYVVYDTSQIKVRYMVQLKFHFH